MTDAACAHAYTVVGKRLTRDMPQFKWVNTILGKLKTLINGAYKSFKFNKYASQYLGAFAYRLNRRVNLNALPRHLLGHAANSRPTRECEIRGVAEVHDGSDDARTWAAEFVRWYNVDHRHSGIRCVRPQQRHTGGDHAILAARHALYQQARQRHPARWSGNIRDGSYINAGALNPERDAVIDMATSAQHTQQKAA